MINDIAHYVGSWLFKCINRKSKFNDYSLHLDAMSLVNDSAHFCASSGWGRADDGDKLLRILDLRFWSLISELLQLEDLLHTEI